MEEEEVYDKEEKREVVMIEDRFENGREDIMLSRVSILWMSDSCGKKDREKWRKNTKDEVLIPTNR